MRKEPGRPRGCITFPIAIATFWNIESSPIHIVLSLSELIPLTKLKTPKRTQHQPPPRAYGKVSAFNTFSKGTSMRK
ncbi:hypothetical protein WA026_013445 [Henosepilachna vigintioctopunctata]|uniref:Uncharacterized protein n=1 Tax=Henosepilachna vigintioctopunctata TaxID=420089 RepID=A0AAW1VDG4_9CUCU